MDPVARENGRSIDLTRHIIGVLEGDPNLVPVGQVHEKFGGFKAAAPAETLQNSFFKNIILKDTENSGFQRSTRRLS